MTTADPGGAGGGQGETTVLWVGASVAAPVAVLHLAAHLAAWLGGTGPFRGGVVESATALLRLPGSLADPAAAFGSVRGAELPGAGLLYVSLVMVAGAAVALVTGVFRVIEVRRRRAHPLGVEPFAGVGDARQAASLLGRPEPGELLVGKMGRRDVRVEPGVSLAVVGPTGCGKTAGFAIPALLEWEGPVLATSVKTDLLSATIERRRGLGEVSVYDPTCSSGEAGATWSPLSGCAEWSGALRTSAWLVEAAQARLDTVTDGDYWYTQARKALAPLLFAAAVGRRVTEPDAEIVPYSMSDVVRWVDEHEQDEVRRVLLDHLGLAEDVDERAEGPEGDDLRAVIEPAARAQVVDDLRHLLSARPDGDARLADRPVYEWPIAYQEDADARVDEEVERRVRERIAEIASEELAGSGDLAALSAIEGLWAQDWRLLGSVYSTMQNVLLGYSDPGVAEAARGSDLDFDRWLGGPNTLFVVAPSHEQSRLRPVFTTLVQQAVQGAYEAANRAGGSLERPLLVLLDEAANIASLRSLPEYAATCRSHGITLVSIFQDLGQVKALYHDRAATVLNNHRAKLFGSGIADVDTLSYVSRLVGDGAFVERGFSADVARAMTPAMRKTMNERTVHRPAVPMDVMRRLPPGEGLLIHGADLPVHVRLRLWYEDAELRRLAEDPQGARPQAGAVRRLLPIFGSGVICRGTSGGPGVAT